MIAIRELNKYYGAKQALKDVNLHFETGRIYGIVGENGAGKTTLFRCIAGLEKYTGDIVSEGGLLKNRLGFLPTEPFFFSRITGREYIRLLCQALQKETGDIDARNIFELPLDRYASAYSTGMKKKLALTAILLQENDCFILDEPFNGVDIQSNILITGILHELKNLGKTVLISSHIFSTLRDNCDEIHLLRDGACVRTAGRREFDALEADMSRVVIGDRIGRLGLR